MGKIPLMIYVEADVREWIRATAFHKRTTMTAIVTDAIRDQMIDDHNAKEAARGINAKRRRKAAATKAAE